MKHSILLIGCVATLQTLAKGQKEDFHHWHQVSYPTVPAPWDGKQELSFLVTPSQDNGPPGLRLHLMWSASWKTPADKLPPGSKIHVRLHRPNGTIVKSKTQGQWNGAGTGHVTWSLIHTFPWLEGGMEESWLSVRFPTSTYWIEVPYGFTTNPKKSRPKAQADEQGNPALAPAMKNLGETDHLIPWLAAKYDLGAIKDKWRLSMELLNTPEVSCRVELYREDSPWDLYHPRTSLEITNANGKTTKYRKVALRLVGRMRRTDEFVASTRRSTRSRYWGTVKIAVGESTYSTITPSSLFNPSHRAAAPHHKRAVRR